MNGGTPPSKEAVEELRAKPSTAFQCSDRLRVRTKIGRVRSFYERKARAAKGERRRRRHLCQSRRASASKQRVMRAQPGDRVRHKVALAAEGERISDKYARSTTSHLEPPRESAHREPPKESGARLSSLDLRAALYVRALNSSLGLRRGFQHLPSAQREPPRESGARTSSHYVRAHNSALRFEKGFQHRPSAQHEPPRESGARTSSQ